MEKLRQPEKYLLILCVILFTACGTQVNDSLPEDRILLQNDEAVLNSRISYFEQEQILEARNLNAGLLQKSTQIRLALRAEVFPPIIDGQTLHASHVTLQGGDAYVSYSTVNGQYRGGVEIFGILDSNRPYIRSQALFLDTDVSIAVAENNRVFLGEAVDSDHNNTFESPACLEVLEIENGRLTTRSQQIDLPGYNGNDVACFDENVFVTSGSSDGSLSVFKNVSLDLLKQIDLEGAKALAKTDQYIVVLEGAGVNLHLFDRATFGFVKTIALGCTNNYQAKAEMVADGNYVYISAYECGVFGVDLNTEKVKLVVAAPEGGHTNGVSFSDDRLFVANGSAGLQVVEIGDGDFNNAFQIKFEGSTNFVAAEGNLVFVANGAGGLKILELLPVVDDVEISGALVVRADKGQSGYTEKNAASVTIAVAGLYKIETLVWYDSGDEQKNESFYLELQDEDGHIVLPENPNAGLFKIVPDDPGPEHTIYRDSGIFRLTEQKYRIDVYHYAKISRDFPQFLTGHINGAESVHVQGFRLVYFGK